MSNDQIPVLFLIDFTGQSGLFELTKEYTAYPVEDEELIQDGLEYLVNKVTQVQVPNKKKELTLINLKYDAKEN